MPEQLIIPTARPSDSVTFTLLSDDQALPATLSVQSIEVWQEVNKIQRARLIILDGSASEQTFKLSEEDYFIPGKALEIQCGYHSEEESIFKGIVIKHRIRVRDTGKSHLIIECAHPAVKLTKIRKSRYFYERSESDVWSEIIHAYNIQTDINGPTTNHNQLVQFEATDWDYLVARAEVNGVFVIGTKDKIKIVPPDFNQEVSQAINYGSTLLSLDAEIDASSQVKNVKGQTWDFSKTEMTEIEATDQHPLTPGNLSSDDLSDVMQDAGLTLKNAAKQMDEVLQKWVDGTLLRHQLAKIRGRARFQGISSISAGNLIELQGLGDRFNGKAFVSGLKHEIIDGNWKIDVQFGLDAKPFAGQFEIHTPKAAAMQPAVNGLQIGIVTQLGDDPEGDDRIKVNLPLIDPEGEGLWARISTLGAGDSRGVFLRPEIDDEVLVGFVNDDPNNPVILGSLNSSNLPSPVQPEDDNHKKGWTTRAGIEFLIDDDKVAAEIKLPSGKILVLNDDEDEIQIKDNHQNSIVMNSDGITLESGKDIILKSNTGDIQLESINLSGKAEMEAKIEGSASAELSASGSTTIKGSIVQIN